MFGLIPFNREERNIFNYFDELERNFFNNFSAVPSVASIRTDIVEKDGKFILSADLPGFNKEDIKIDINEDVLTISAEHSENKEDKTQSYIRKERRYGKFTRSFNVSDIDVDAITASYNNGVLQLELPKLVEPEKPKKQIEIQ